MNFRDIPMLGVGYFKIIPTIGCKAIAPIILCNALHTPEVMHSLLLLTKAISTGSKILLYDP